MRFVYLILFGVTVAITITDTLMHIAGLDNDMSAYIGLLTGLVTILYSYIKGSFESVYFKEFAYALLVGIVVLVAVTAILIALKIDKQSSPYLFALLAGMYTFKKMNAKRTGMKNAKRDQFFQTRKCPCCQEAISRIYFLKQILFQQGSISFTEKEKGLTCQKCDKPILSAEKKLQISLRPMFVSMVPIMVVGSMDDISFANFIIAFAFSFFIFVLLLLKTYQDADFVCNDESSEEFEYYSIRK